MTRMRHARTRRLASTVLRRSAGAVTAVVLALGGIVVTETASASDDPVPNPEQTTTSTQADEPEEIWSLTFDEEVQESDPDACEAYGGSIEDLRYHCWKRHGNPILGIVADPHTPDTSNNVLEIGRKENHDSIQSPVGVLEPGKAYNISMRVRLDGTSAAGLTEADAYFVGRSSTPEEPDDGEWHWVGKGSVSPDRWTTIAGTWTPSNADTRIYIETTAGHISEFDFYVDDILVTERGDARVTVTDADDAFVPGDTITVAGFDFPTEQWNAKPVTFTFEQDNEPIDHKQQKVTPDLRGWFGDTPVELPVNVDPAKPLYLVAKSEGVVVLEHEITMEEPFLNASPDTVQRGETLTLTGSGFAANMFVRFTADRAATVTERADAEGNVSVTWKAPVVPSDALVITATTFEHERITATTTVKVTTTSDPDAPRVPEIAVIDEGDIVPADVISILGFGFSPNQSGTITMTGNSYFNPVSFETDATGQFYVTDVTLPNYLNPGSATLHAVQTRSGDRAQQDITLASPTVTSGQAIDGGVVTFHGTGFIADQNLNYEVKIGTQTQSGVAWPDAEGRFTAAAPVPFGATEVVVSASQWGRNTGVLTIPVSKATDPLIVPAFEDVPRGSPVTITGHNFTSGEIVSLSSSGFTTVHVIVKGDGTFSYDITINPGTQLGEVTITAGDSSGLSAATTVNVITAKRVDKSWIRPAEVNETSGENFTVHSGDQFKLIGSYFDPNAPVTLQYFEGNFAEETQEIGGDPIGGDTVVTSPLGRIDHTIVMPHVDGVVTIVATQGEHHARAKVIVEQVQTSGSINIDGGTYTPGTPVRVNWTGLVAGHVMVTMSTEGASLADGYVIVPEPGDGQGYVTIGVDTLTGTESYEVTVKAAQGDTKREAVITVTNDFDPYDKALEVAWDLIERNNEGEFRGIDAPWGELTALTKSNEFENASQAARTQGMANRSRDALLAVMREISEKLLRATLTSADDVLASYAAALKANAALAEAVGGSAQALVESMAAMSESSLIPTTDIPKPTPRLIAKYYFEEIGVPDIYEQPGIPDGVWSTFAIEDDPENVGEHVLEITRVTDWDGLDLPAQQFSAADTCSFSADVGFPADQGVDDISIRFVVHYTTPNADGTVQKHWTWIASKTVAAGGTALISNPTWNDPDDDARVPADATIKYVRLVAGRLNAEDDRFPDYTGHISPTDGHFTSAYRFTADNVEVSCTRQADPVEIRTEPATLLKNQKDLSEAIARLKFALAHFDAGQVVWAPAPGNEPGWVEGSGLYTDDSLARWIGGNLYIRGNSSELEGRTFVANDLSLDKWEAYGWKGFNFGTVSIGSQIALSGDKPALLVCDDMGVYNGSSANINGGVVGIVNEKDGPIYGTWTEKAHEYCKGEDLTKMAEGIERLSMSLAERPTDGSCDCTEDGEGQAKASNAVVEGGDKLVLTAGDPNADGLYVFEIQGSELARATSIVIDGLQVGQSSRAEGGRIDSMKPAVINVVKDVDEDWKPLEWTVDSIYLRDDGYDQLYVGDKFWHPDLGKVAGALLWNFPHATDNRAGYGLDGGNWTNGTDGWDIGLSIDVGITASGFKPAVTIRTEYLGVNFLGSILIPRGSLATENVSLNGRLYVGGDYLMDDTLKKRLGDPLYGGGYYDGTNESQDLLGHSEGHNYPWWFDPFTAAPSSDPMKITKNVALGVVDQLNNAGLASGQSLFAKGLLRCMHVEDAAERHLTPQSDGWWADGLKNDPYLLTVDVAWWLKVGDNNGISIPALPQGTLCGLSEDLGLFTADSDTTSGVVGLLPRGSAEGAAECGCDDDDLVTPTFAPVNVPVGWAWALPGVTFDTASHPVTVTSQGPTASLLLTTKTQAPNAEIMNSLVPLGQAQISKLAQIAEGPADLKPVAPAASPDFKFTWSTPLDGYVQVPVDEHKADFPAGSYPAPGTSAGPVTLKAGDEPAKPQYCPEAGAVPPWWPASWYEAETPLCQDLWFPQGERLTWTEEVTQHTIEGVVYDVESVDYQGGQTVTIPGEGGTASEPIKTEVINTLLKAPARFGVKKTVKGTGSDLVPDDTEFTIVYKAWKDDGDGKFDEGGSDLLLNACQQGEGVCDANTLVVRPDGQTEYSHEYDADTWITLVFEHDLPEITGVTWGTPEFTTEPFQLKDGVETKVITVTNTAHGAASFTLSKALPADNVGTAWKVNFDLVYTVYEAGDRTKSESARKTHTLSNGIDLTSGAVTEAGGRKLQIGDIVAISEPADGFDTGFNWDKNGYAVEVTGLDSEGKRTVLTSCEARGFAKGETCSAREFKITAGNINSLSVTVVNRLVGPPDMPMTGGALAAWLAVVAGLGLGGYLSFRRAYTVRHATSRGGAMR